MEKQLPKYLTERGIYKIAKKNILTDEELEKLRTMTADKGVVELDNGDVVRAVELPFDRYTSPCADCYLKHSCVSETSELKTPNLYLRACLPHKREDRKSVRFVKIGSNK